MKNHSFERTKYFVLSFGATFLALLLLALGMAHSLQKTESGQQNTAEAPKTDDYYIPRAEDNLNILLIGSDTAGSPARYFFLARLNAVRGEIPVAVLPPQTVVSYGGAPATLTELFAKSGAMAVKQALGEALGVTIDRYAAFTGEALVQAVDLIGYVEYNLPKALIYKDATVSINLTVGRQLVDGQKFYDILRFPAYESEDARGIAASELLAHYVNNRLEAVLSPEADELFQNVINLTESDLSFQDYDSRKEALRFLAKLSGKHARGVLVRGVWNTAGDSMSLSESTRELMKLLYG